MITVRGVSTPELTQVGYLIAGDQKEVRDKVVNMFVTCVSLSSKRYFPCSITSYLQCAAAHIPVHDSELLIAEYISNEIHIRNVHVFILLVQKFSFTHFICEECYK